MSWATCYSASNNIHFNYPPIMADGRNYASWQPEAVINQRIQNQEGIKNNWQYRQFMQHNGLGIMKYNSAEACYELGLDPHCKSDTTPSSNVPYTFSNAFDNSQPGYGYCNSDLKNPYLSSEQLNSRMVAPVINPASIQQSEQVYKQQEYQKQYQ